MKILLIEDDPLLAREIREHLERYSLQVEHVADGNEGLRKAIENEHDLLILDIMLPGRNGFDVCREVRAAKTLLPILIITSLGGETDTVLGLELGADDYLVKPFSHSELVARVRSKLRRHEEYIRSGLTNVTLTEPSVEIGGLRLDRERRLGFLHDQEISLTAKEFDFLSFMMRYPGKVFSRLELLRQIWEVDVQGYEEAVVSLVRRLRRKIEHDPDNPIYLKTARGVGYSFAEQRDFDTPPMPKR